MDGPYVPHLISFFSTVLFILSYDMVYLISAHQNVTPRGKNCLFMIGLLAHSRVPNMYQMLNIYFLRVYFKNGSTIKKIVLTYEESKKPTANTI